MQHALAYQGRSAVKAARKAGIKHGQTVEATVVVGVTPEGSGSRQATGAHFCSALFTVNRIREQGDGTLIPMDHRITFPNGLPTVSAPSFLKTETIIRPNGTFQIRGPRRSLAVEIPPRLKDFAYWAHSGGAEQLAFDMGCNSVDDLFEKHGVHVS